MDVILIVTKKKQKKNNWLSKKIYGKDPRFGLQTLDSPTNQS
jgi:hypothetical protein